MHESILRVIIDSEKELREAKERIERIERLVNKFPDLQQFEGRWKKIAYGSQSVNSVATDVEFRYNCGCCNDSPFEAWVYIDTPDGRVYASPAYFRVGEKHWESGAEPYPDWERKLRDANISETVISRINDRFESDKRERIAELAEAEADLT